MSWEQDDNVFSLIFRETIEFFANVVSKGFDEEWIGRPAINHTPFNVLRQFAAE